MSCDAVHACVCSDEVLHTDRSLLYPAVIYDVVSVCVHYIYHICLHVYAIQLITLHVSIFIYLMPHLTVYLRLFFCFCLWHNNYLSLWICVWVSDVISVLYHACLCVNLSVFYADGDGDISDVFIMSKPIYRGLSIY